MPCALRFADVACPTACHCRGQASPYQPAISPEPVAHLAQHRLLPLLVEAVKQQPLVELRMGHRQAGQRGTVVPP